MPNMGNGADPAFWGAILLVAVLFAVGLFDVIALTSAGRVLTISSVLQGWSRDYALLPLTVGVIIGHLFFPTRPPGA